MSSYGKYDPKMDEIVCEMTSSLQNYYKQLGAPRFFRGLVTFMLVLKGGIAFSNAKGQLIARIERLGVWDLNEISEKDVY